MDKHVDNPRVTYDSVTGDLPEDVPQHPRITWDPITRKLPEDVPQVMWLMREDRPWPMLSSS